MEELEWTCAPPPKWTSADCGKVLFTNESKSNLFGSDGT
ncbi:hypothetical protein V3C99_018355, partial [Haemonchus contortus]